MENEQVVEQFKTELQNIGIYPELEGDTMRIEFAYEKELQQQFNTIRDRYIGTWKGIAIKTDHSFLPSISRYQIPLKFITGKDITDEQLYQAVENVARNINGLE